VDADTRKETIVNMRVLGIDPGPNSYAWALLDVDVQGDGMAALLCYGDDVDIPVVAVESVAVEKIMPYGQRIGESVMDTIRTEQSAAESYERLGFTVVRIPRKVIVVALCGKASAGDKQVNAVMQRLCPDLKGKRKGLNGHHRAAAAVAYVGAGRVK
jgi:Holliday junction resolvasome RuvABC endonuclease subunit